MVAATDRQTRFESVYRAHVAAIGRYASRRTDAADAVDVVAETFAVAWRRIDEVPPDALPWLYGVARRVLANQRRGGIRRTALHTRLCEAWVQPVSPPPAHLETLRTAIHSLTEADREILLLAGAEELSPREIAVVLDLRPEVARNRLSRARQRLRDAMPDDEGASA